MRFSLLICTFTSIWIMSAFAFGQTDSMDEVLTKKMPYALGGGLGYNYWVEDPDILVKTKDDLLSALSQAKVRNSKTVIYVKDRAKIDLSGHWNIEIPSNVTLASGRGKEGSQGALLFTRNIEKNRALFLVTGKNVRVTGLRLRGPLTSINSPGCEKPRVSGVKVSSSRLVHMNLEVDNNEFFGWPHGAVNTYNVKGVHVHHNHFHHNRWQERDPECKPAGLGYGVVTSLGHVTIDSNLFNNNRHDIASTGLPGSSYTAKFNVSVEGLISHSFDMHGCTDHKENMLCKGKLKVAGRRMDVYDNIFLQPDMEAIRVRGIPEVGAFIGRNYFRQFKTKAVNQIYHKGNFFVAKDNEHIKEPSYAWFVSLGGRGAWKFKRLTDALTWPLLGDFDGDSELDGFKSTGDTWIYTRWLRDPWVKINSSTANPSALKVGSFDDEPGDDIFYSDGQFWYVSSSGADRWQKIGKSSHSVSKLRLGDFDGNGITDIFHKDGRNWNVSFGKRKNGVGSPIKWTSWIKVGTSGHPVEHLRFGDFNGDGLTDIFHKEGNYWQVSFAKEKRNGSIKMTGWQEINYSKIPLDYIKFGDFNGDRATDIVYGDGVHWYVSWSAQSGWQKLNRSGVKLGKECKVADTNGDGIDDIICLRKI